MRISFKVQPPEAAPPSNNLIMLTEAALSRGRTERQDRPTLRTNSARRASARPLQRARASYLEEIPSRAKLPHLVPDSTRLTDHFLIENTGLEFRPTHSKQSPLKIPNRKWIAFSRSKSCLSQKRVERDTALAVGFRLITRHSSLVTGEPCPPRRVILQNGGFFADAEIGVPRSLGASRPSLITHHLSPAARALLGGQHCAGGAQNGRNGNKPNVQLGIQDGRRW
jgi:hypothetical protein